MARASPELVAVAGGGLAALAAALVFSPVIGFDFLLWDDNLTVLTNPHIRSLSPENLWWMFTDFSRIIRYVPLSWLLWAIDYRLGGLRPSVFHFSYFVLHVANAWLVYLLLRTLLRIAAARTASDPRQDAWRDACAALGAASWAVHPLRAESVSWVTGGTSVQGLFFLLLSLLLYLRHASADESGGRRGAYLASLVAFVASLLSHPYTLAAPAVLIVLDWFPLRRLGRDGRFWGRAERAVWLEKLPFFAASAALLALTLWVRLTRPGLWESAASLERFGPLARLAQALYVWAYYAWRPLFPFRLSPVSGELVSFAGSEPRFVVAGALVAALSVAAVLARRRWPALSALWAAHLLLLVPVLGLTERPHFAADRYSYLVGLCGALLAASLLYQAGARSAGLRKAGLLLAIPLVLALAALGRKQALVWRDDQTLFRYMAARLGDDPLAFEAYYRLALGALQKNQPEAALRELEQGLRRDPASVPGWALRGTTLAKQGRFEEAKGAFERALALRSAAPGASAGLHNSLGLVLLELHREPEALAHFKLALAEQPRLPGLRLNLAVTLARLGRHREAQAECLAILRAAPDDPDAARLLEQLRPYVGG